MQLQMWWDNTGEEPCVKLPEGFYIRSFEGEKDVEKWVRITREDLQNSILAVEDFEREMLNREGVEKEHIYFICIEGEEVATVTAVMYPGKRQGYVHMVAVKRAFRGRGLGNALTSLALKVFFYNGMDNAYLHTDDFRIPAIKSYLRSGFKPMLYQEDMEERWLKGMENCNIDTLECVDGDGKFLKIIERKELQYDCE